jgi:hypothetical protein
MRAFVTLVLIAGFGLAGCATVPAPTPSSNGVLLSLHPAAVQKLVGDASVKLRALYPAASTQFELQQATPDAFGTGLIESLRASGYAVLEAAPVLPPTQPTTQPATQPYAVAPSAAAARGLPLRYIVDAPADLNLHRVLLLVGTSSLSRAYMVAPDTTLQPAGAWVRKE